MNARELPAFTGGIVRRFVLRLLPPPTKFLVVTRGRTGSNLLLALLSSHPAIRTCGEVVGESQLRQQDVKAQILASGPLRYVESCFIRWSIFESAVGIKILYYQVEKDYALKWGVEGLPKLFDFLKSNKDIKIIHVKRRNRLKTLVSMKVAGTSKQYVVSDNDARVDDIQIELSADQCDREFNRIGRWEREYDEAFYDHDMLEVHYEDLVSDADRECDRILDFLGVRHRRLQSIMLKQNRRPLSEIINNYEELKAQFAGSAWEGLFED